MSKITVIKKIRPITTTRTAVSVFFNLLWSLAQYTTTTIRNKYYTRNHNIVCASCSAITYYYYYYCNDEIAIQRRPDRIQRATARRSEILRFAARLCAVAHREEIPVTRRARRLRVSPEVRIIWIVDARLNAKVYAGYDVVKTTCDKSKVVYTNVIIGAKVLLPQNPRFVLRIIIYCLIFIMGDVSTFKYILILRLNIVKLFLFKVVVKVVLLFCFSFYANTEKIIGCYFILYR